MAAMDLSAHATEYTFLPAGTGPDDPSARTYGVRMVRRGDGQWAILHADRAWTGTEWTDPDGSDVLLTDLDTGARTASALPAVVKVNGLSYAEAWGTAPALEITPRAPRSPSATIFDLAAAILAETGEIATMRLHKLAFYAQAWHMVWDEELLVHADFFAWGSGPVNPELHASHRGVFLISEVPGDPSVFTEDQLESIHEVVRCYGGLRAFVLSGIVKNEAPWQDAWAGTESGKKGRLIEGKAMLEFYAVLDGQPVEEIAAEAV
jgi:uncharacterized phage-associated protein